MTIRKQAHPLLIIAPQIGAQSETFIRKHMNELAPGQTAVAAQVTGRSQEAAWRAAGPVFDLNHAESTLIRRAVRWAGRRIGYASFTDAARARAFLRSHGVRVAMAEYLDFGTRWLELLAELRIPFFGHAHGADVSALLRQERWREAYRGYADAAGVITVSHFHRQRLIELGLPATRIHVIPCGVDLPPQPRYLQDRLPVRCVAVGRMVAKKAPVYLLDAFRRALLSFPDLHLDYLGGGPLAPAAQQFVRALGLEPYVTLHGAQPHHRVGELLANADLFLQHSVTDPETGDEEGLPVGILEAMAHGVPVVATRHSGIPEAVEHARSGLLVPEGDTAAMAECIVELARDVRLRQQYGTAARERIGANFTWERERERLLELFRSHAAL